MALKLAVRSLKPHNVLPHAVVGPCVLVHEEDNPEKQLYQSFWVSPPEAGGSWPADAGGLCEREGVRIIFYQGAYEAGKAAVAAAVVGGVPEDWTRGRHANVRFCGGRPVPKVNEYSVSAGNWGCTCCMQPAGISMQLTGCMTIDRAV